MKIETKFNVRDIIYHMRYSDIRKERVTKIKINVYNESPCGTTIQYETANGTINQESCFSTKKETAEAIMKSLGFSTGLEEM